MAFQLRDVDVQRTRERLLDATHALLSMTIAISDEDWQRPSWLPGWTRAHVASHLSRNADRVRAIAEQPERPITGGDDLATLEQESLRSALEIQIDLDTSASRLDDALARLSVDQWQAPVSWPGHPPMTVQSLPIARLLEVQMHHIDLAVGYTAFDVPDDLAAWLLPWALEVRSTADGWPVAPLVCGDDHVWRWRESGEPTKVVRQHLLGWVIGRHPAPAEVGLPSALGVL